MKRHTIALASATIVSLFLISVFAPAISFDPVPNEDQSGDRALGDDEYVRGDLEADGYIPIRTITELLAINDSTSSLSEKYYLVNDLDFSEFNNPTAKEIGFLVRFTGTTTCTISVTLIPQGETVTRMYMWVDDMIPTTAVQGTAGPSRNVSNIPIDSQFTMIIAGQLSSGATFAHSMDVYSFTSGEFTSQIKTNGVIAPIGSGIDPFRGTFDGNGRVIKGMEYSVYSSTGVIYAGLFGVLDGATVKNLGMTGNQMTAVSVNQNIYTGGIAGEARGTVIIDNCYNTGTIASSVDVEKGSLDAGIYAGGVVGNSIGDTTIYKGRNSGSVIAMLATGASIKGTMQIGGIVGASSGRVWIEECRNVGILTGKSTNDASNAAAIRMGGILGYGSGTSSIIYNCYNNGVTLTGSITGTGNIATPPALGGIAGVMGATTSAVVNCYTNTKITGYSSRGTPSAGGIVGSASVITYIINSYYLGNNISTNGGNTYTNGALSSTTNTLRIDGSNNANPGRTGSFASGFKTEAQMTDYPTQTYYPNTTSSTIPQTLINAFSNAYGERNLWAAAGNGIPGWEITNDPEDNIKKWTMDRVRTRNGYPQIIYFANNPIKFQVDIREGAGHYLRAVEVGGVVLEPGEWDGLVPAGQSLKFMFELWDDYIYFADKFIVYVNDMPLVGRSSPNYNWMTVMDELGDYSYTYTIASVERPYAIFAINIGHAVTMNEGPGFTARFEPGTEPVAHEGTFVFNVTVLDEYKPTTLNVEIIEGMFVEFDFHEDDLRDDKHEYTFTITGITSDIKIFIKVDPMICDINVEVDDGDFDYDGKPSDGTFGTRDYGESLVLTFKADYGHNLEKVDDKYFPVFDMNGSRMASGDYTYVYNRETRTGTLTIPFLIGDIDIKAECQLNVYSVTITYDPNDIDIVRDTSREVTHGDDYEDFIFEIKNSNLELKHGSTVVYGSPGWEKETPGNMLDVNLDGRTWNIVVKNVQNDIQIVITADEIFKVTVNKTNTAVEGNDWVIEGTDLELKFKADQYHNLPDDVEVIMEGTNGDAPLIKGTHYSYDKETGILNVWGDTINTDHVGATGDVTVTVISKPDVYTVTVVFVRDGETVSNPAAYVTYDSKATYGTNYQFSFVVENGFQKTSPDVSVTNGNLSGGLKSGTTADYEYSVVNFTDNFTITIVVYLNEYDVTFTGKGFIVFRGDSQISYDTVKHGGEYVLRFVIDEGYANEPSKVQAILSELTKNNGAQGALEVGPYNTFYTLTVTDVTGDLDFEITLVKIWTISVDVSNATTSPATIESPVYEGSSLQFTLYADSKYKLPNSITVTMGSATLQQNAFGYAYTLSADGMSATFELRRSEGVKGDVVITGTSTPTWVITPNLRPGVTFSPATATTVDNGDEFTFTLVMADTYVLREVKIVTKAGAETILLSTDDNGSDTFTYKITNVTEDLWITVTVDKTWTVSTDVSNASTSLSSNPKTVDDGDPLQFTLTANSGYRLPDTISVTMTGFTGLTAGTDYTYTLSADKTSATFVLTRSGGVMGDVVITGTSVKTWNITVPTGTGYTAAPSGVTVIDNGTNFTFTLSATAGYRIDPDSVGMTGTGSMSYTGPNAGVYTFTITDIASDITVDIGLNGSGLIKTWNINVPAGTGYTATPSGITVIDDGDDFTFTLSANAGYRINDPDGVGMTGTGSMSYTGPVNGVYTYTITDIESDITVVIGLNGSGLIKTWDVTLSNGKGYVLDPAGGVYVVDDTGSFTFTVEVLDDYEVPDALVTISPGTGSGTLSGTQTGDNVYEFTISGITGDIVVSVNVIKFYTVNVTYNAGAGFEYSWDGWSTVYTPELDPEGGVYSFEAPEGSVLLMRAVSHSGYNVAWEDDASPARRTGPNFIGPTTRDGSDIEELNITLTFTLSLKSSTLLWLILATIMLALITMWFIWGRDKEEEEEQRLNH